MSHHACLQRLLAPFAASALFLCDGCSSGTSCTDQLDIYTLSLDRLMPLAPSDAGRMTVELCVDGTCATASTDGDAGTIAQGSLPVSFFGGTPNAHCIPPCAFGTLYPSGDGMQTYVALSLRLGEASGTQVRLRMLDANGNERFVTTTGAQWTGGPCHVKPATLTL